jgi:outer membrane protein TolC
MRKLLLLFAILPFTSVAQTDSLLQLNTLYAVVLQYHPLALQAQIDNDIAGAQLLSARGVFDPKVAVDLDKKVYQDKEYYSILSSEFKIPTWLGIDFKIAYDNNTGTYLNPQNTVPADGLLSAGFSLPVGQGMWTDRRRNVVNQAKAMVQQSKAEQLMQLNDLLLAVAEDYYQWQYRYYSYQQIKQGYELAAARLNFVRERVLNGDLAAIDSVEATIEVQQRFVQMTQAGMDYVNSSLELSNQMWGENNTPQYLAPQIIPAVPVTDTINVETALIDSMVSVAMTQHPKLLYTRAKIQQLEIDKTFKSNLLMPNLRLDYNFLNAANTVGDISNPDFNSNYKVGLGFEYPLFLRKERGDIKVAKFKISDAQYDLTVQSRMLENKIRASGNELQSLLVISSQQQLMVNNYVILRNGEQERFDNGESSLLFINIRERSLIDAQIKLYEIQTKTALTKEKLLWNAGTLSLNK